MSGMYGSEVRRAPFDLRGGHASRALRAEHLALLHAGPDGLRQHLSTPTPE